MGLWSLSDKADPVRPRELTRRRLPKYIGNLMDCRL
jgi:hypothetical protein